MVIGTSRSQAPAWERGAPVQPIFIQHDFAVATLRSIYRQAEWEWS